MTAFPKLQTAIPQRRYHYGDYQVSILGDVQSGDEHDYIFVAAFVLEGESRPRLYVVSERVAGGVSLRVINASMDETLETDSRWARLGEFSDQALRLGSQLLGLEQETAYPLG
ncbi:MAG: hypothetical protein KDI82_04505 [Gammaproteobacteria bacterium]|nr:hypothetical protein [Gammaproteobacteria bacterium]